MSEQTSKLFKIFEQLKLHTLTIILFLKRNICSLL